MEGINRKCAAIISSVVGVVGVPRTTNNTMNQTWEECRAQTTISEAIDAGVGEPTVSRRHQDSESSESDSSGSESEERQVPEQTRKVESKENTVREWRADEMERRVDEMERRTDGSTVTHEEGTSSSSDDEVKTIGAQRTGTAVEANIADKLDAHVNSLFTDDENSKPFYLERSITNKANCRHCRLSIAKNEWRFGRAISRRKNHPEMFKAWYHVDCIFLAYADPTRSRKTNTSMPPYLLKDPKREINDWAFVDEEQQRRFVEQLAELHRRNKREAVSPSDESSDDDDEEDEFGNSRCDKKRNRRLRRNGRPSTPEAPSLALFGKRVIDQRLVNKCKREFAGLEGKHDSLEAFGRLRTLLASNKLNNSERLDVLQLWFHPSTFKGDLFLWFTVLINVAMKRSFHVKDKQLIKLFSTKIFHVPLGTIESRILERNNRGSIAREATTEAQSEASSGEEPVAQHLSRSVLRRINVRNLPSLLADMFSEMTNSRIKPREQSILSLRTTWDTLVAIGGMKKEVERNRALTRLLLQCTTRDIEEILRMLLSVLDLKLNKKHIIDAFSETAYAQWEGRKHKIFKEEHFDELIKLIDWDKLHKERGQLCEQQEKQSSSDTDLLAQIEDKLKQLHHETEDTKTSVENGVKRKLEDGTTTTIASITTDTTISIDTTASTTAVPSTSASTVNTNANSTATDTSSSNSSTAANTQPTTRLQTMVPPTRNSSPNLILHIPKKRRIDSSAKDGTQTPSPQHGISDGILAAALVAQRELPYTPGSIPDTQRSPFHHSVSYLLSSVNASHRSSALSPNNYTLDCTPPLDQKPKTPTPVISMFNHPTPSLLPPMIPLRKSSPQKLP